MPRGNPWLAHVGHGRKSSLRLKRKPVARQLIAPSVSAGTGRANPRADAWGYKPSCDWFRFSRRDGFRPYLRSPFHLGGEGVIRCEFWIRTKSVDCWWRSRSITKDARL